MSKHEEKLKLIKQAVYNKQTRCLEWIASVDTDGYPHARIFSRVKRVHRWLLELKLNRAFWNDEFANHKCDNKRCISTAKEHVYLGDRSQNTKDSITRGTHNLTKARAKSRG